jgi:hypothetical protein
MEKWQSWMTKKKNTVPKTMCPKDVVMDEEEDGTEPTTTRIEIGCNDVNSTHKKIGSTSYVR